MAKKKTGVWKMELDRFGYYLVVIGRNTGECETAMREEYIRAYAKRNNLDEMTCRLALEFPVEDEDGVVYGDNPYNQFAEDYRNAFEDCVPRFYEFGKVEWE